MDFTVNMLAEYEVRVANYYMRRGAYVAAANRAKESVIEFPQTASTRRGAVHHGAVLRQAGPDAAARRRAARAGQELPDSTFAAVDQEARPWWKFW